MTLSSLLLGVVQGRQRWVEVGGSMIAVDTLVHNFLHRSGILDRLNAGHRYGPICYREESGCVGVLEAVAQYDVLRKVTVGEGNLRNFATSISTYRWAICRIKSRITAGIKSA